MKDQEFQQIFIDLLVTVSFITGDHIS